MKSRIDAKKSPMAKKFGMILCRCTSYDLSKQYEHKSKYWEVRAKSESNLGLIDAMPAVPG